MDKKDKSQDESSLKAQAQVKDYSKLYKDVKIAVETGLTDISDIKISDTEAKQHVENIKKELYAIKDRFDGEIKFIENNSEWDKFSIAFFGETNAGKSIIIESLRIVFQEKERQKLIEQNKADLKVLEKKFAVNTENLINKLGNVYSSYANEIEKISSNITTVRDFCAKEYGYRRQAIRLLLGFLLGFSTATLLLIEWHSFALWLGIGK